MSEHFRIVVSNHPNAPTRLGTSPKFIDVHMDVRYDEHAPCRVRFTSAELRELRSFLMNTEIPA